MSNTKPRLSNYANSKIQDIRRAINLIEDPEMRGNIIDLINEVESGDAFRKEKERTFCVGYTLGVSLGTESSDFMGALGQVQGAYQSAQESHYL